MNLVVGVCSSSVYLSFRYVKRNLMGEWLLRAFSNLKFESQIFHIPKPNQSSTSHQELQHRFREQGIWNSIRICSILSENKGYGTPLAIRCISSICKLFCLFLF